MQSTFGAISTSLVVQETALPVLFVVDCDRNALEVLLADLSRRFGNDFAMMGRTSPDEALTVLQGLASAERAVALLLVDAAASEGFLAHAHELHPLAKRVLLVDRDYSTTSPAVPAMTLGRADYHIVRPWANNETMYRAMSEYLASWTREHDPTFEEFGLLPARATDERSGCAT